MLVVAILVPYAVTNNTPEIVVMVTPLIVVISLPETGPPPIFHPAPTFHPAPIYTVMLFPL
jgi:hypothetical protein